MMNTIHRFLLLLIAVLFSGTILTAAEDGLQIESCAGTFSGKIANQAWNPWSVVVVNSSDREQQAQIVLRLQQFPVSYLRAVKIPPHTRYPVSLALRPEYAPEQFQSFFKSAKSVETLPDGKKKEIVRINGNLECVAALVDPGTGQERKPMRVLSLLQNPQSLSLVIVDDDPGEIRLPFSGVQNGLPYVLGDRVTPAGQDGRNFPMLVLNEQFRSEEERAGVQMSFVNSDRIPCTDDGFDAINLLALGRHKQLNPAQKMQLRRWVAGGGRLAVFPVADFVAFRNDSFWREMLPVSLLGVREAGAEDNAAYEKTCGGAFDLARKPLLAGAVLKPGAELLCGTPAAVLAARQTLGAGEVYFYALRGSDLQSAKSPGAAIAYVNDLTRPVSLPLPGLPERFARNAQNLLQTLTGTPVPEKWLIALVMFLFLGVGTAILLVLRLKKRAELGWPLLMVWSLIIFGAAMVIMNAGTSGLSLSSGEIGVTLLPPGSGTGVNQSTAGAYPFGDIRGRLSWRQKDAALAPFTASSAGEKVMAAGQAVSQDYYPGLPQVQMSPGQFWGARSLAAAEFGQGVQAEMVFAGSGVYGTVKNRTGRKLEHVLVCAGRRILYLGTLSDGAGADLAQAQIYTLEEFAKKDFGTGWSDRRNILSQLLFPTSFHNQPAAVPVLIGFTGERLCDFEISGDSSKNNPRQLLATVPTLRASGEKVTIPVGMCGMTFTGAASFQSYYGYPQRKTKGDHDALSMPAPRPGAGSRPGQPAAKFSVGKPAQKAPEFDPAYDCAFPGWQSGDNPATRFSLRYTPPTGLTGFRPQSAALLFRGELSGLNLEVSIRKPGAEKAQKIGQITPAQSAAEIKIDKFSSFFGKNGELPEIEVQMKQILRAGAPGTATWRIQELELQMTGAGEP